MDVNSAKRDRRIFADRAPAHLRGENARTHLLTAAPTALDFASAEDANLAVRNRKCKPLSDNTPEHASGDSRCLVRKLLNPLVEFVIGHLKSDLLVDLFLNSFNDGQK